MSTVRTEFFATLTEISDDALSEIAADGHSFASLEWLRLLDRIPISVITGGDITLAYAVTLENDCPVAICPLLRVRGRGAYFAYSIRRYYFEHWIDELVRSNPSVQGPFARLIAAVNGYRQLLDWSHSPLDECLIATSPLSVRGLIAVSPSARTDRSTIYASIVHSLQHYCRRKRLPLWFFGVSGERSRLADTLLAHGCQRTFLFHDNVVEVEGYRRFNDYLQSFRKSTRRALQRELAGAQRSGVEITLADDIEPIADDLADLDARVPGRVDDTRLKQPREFWTALADSHGPNAEALLAHHDDRLLGFHVLLRNNRRGEMWTYRSRRLDPTSVPSRRMASTLAFYEPIRRAISLGYRRIWLGPSGYEAKTLRGARQVPLYSYFWFPRRWDRWLLAPYLQQFGQITREHIAQTLERPPRLKAAWNQVSRPTTEK